MNKKIIIIATILVAVLGGIAWLKFPTKQQNTAPLLNLSQGFLETKETNFDFGTISMAKGKVKHSFQIKNTGEEPVIIEKIYTSCMCTTASLEIDGKKFGPFGMQGHGFIPKINKELGPNKKALVDVEFDPAAHGLSGIGYVKRIVYLETSAGLEQLEISAKVTP
jgi:hypothetical protein